MAAKRRFLPLPEADRHFRSRIRVGDILMLDSRTMDRWTVLEEQEDSYVIERRPTLPKRGPLPPMGRKSRNKKVSL